MTKWMMSIRGWALVRSTSWARCCWRGPRWPRQGSGRRTGAGELRILMLGDSLTAGYGLAARDALPAQLEAALRARDLDVRVINAGVSGDTTAGWARAARMGAGGPPPRGHRGAGGERCATGHRSGARKVEPGSAPRRARRAPPPGAPRRDDGPPATSGGTTARASMPLLPGARHPARGAPLPLPARRRRHRGRPQPGGRDPPERGGRGG